MQPSIIFYKHKCIPCLFLLFSVYCDEKKSQIHLSFFIICVSLQLSPTDKSLEFDRDFRIRHYAGDVV